MKFSVVIPLYNKAPYISCAVQSVLNQSLADFEVIVVDDGSSDQGAEIVKSMNDPRVSVTHQANSGVSEARNLGISLARGEWVALLDADDWHHPDHLAHLVRAQQAWPQADAVATDFVKVVDAEGPWPPRWGDIANTPEVELITDLPMRWLISQSICSSSIAIRRKRLEHMQPCFPPGEFQAEDLDFWFRLAEQTPIALTHVPLVAYRVEVSESLTTKHSTIGVPKCIERMHSRAFSGEMTLAQRKSALWFIAQHKVSMARMALAIGDRQQGLKWLLEGRHAASGKRWWLTAAMTFFFPKSLVSAWDRWRTSRKLPHTGIIDADN